MMMDTIRHMILEIHNYYSDIWVLTMQVSSIDLVA